MTRALQQRLALANVKIKHGWESLSLDSIEPQINQQIKRKRPSSNDDTLSDTSSAVSNTFYAARTLTSSPLLGPTNPRDVRSSGSNLGQRKRCKTQQVVRQPASSNGNRNKIRPATFGQSWKSEYRLPESSPVYHRKHVHYPNAIALKHSFVSETSTIPEDPPSSSHSDEEDVDLPLHSFRADTPYIRSSPPCTPPPSGLRNRRGSRGIARNTKAGEEGVDLLLYLATSPSPAYVLTKTGMAAPHTPPSKHTPLPSSVMNTPGGGALFGLGPNTPSTNFNFADFVNITPSPAQVPWRTPGAAKTPIAAREARRRLNFDTLLPPTGSPSIGGQSRSGAEKATGLGMELGGELVA